MKKVKFVILVSIGLFSVQAFASNGCGERNVLYGKEDGIYWDIYWDFDKGTHKGTGSKGEMKTSQIHVTCSGSTLSAKQSGASDKNNCTYSGHINGNNVSGTYTCDLVDGVHEFSGKLLTD